MYFFAERALFFGKAESRKKISTVTYGRLTSRIFHACSESAKGAAKSIGRGVFLLRGQASQDVGRGFGGGAGLGVGCRGERRCGWFWQFSICLCLDIVSLFFGKCKLINSLRFFVKNVIPLNSLTKKSKSLKKSIEKGVVRGSDANESSVQKKDYVFDISTGKSLFLKQRKAEKSSGERMLSPSLRGAARRRGKLILTFYLLLFTLIIENF